MHNTSELEPITRLGLSVMVILSGSFMAPLLMHSSTLAIPTIASDLNLDAQLISWFSLLNMLGSAVFVLPAGKLADIFGRRLIFCYGVGVSTIACIIGGTTDSAVMLLAGRLLQGVGGAFIFGSAVALVNGIPPADKKVQVLGIYMAVCYLGIVIGPLFGGWVVQNYHWRWVFIIPAIVMGLTALVGFIFLKWERYGNRQSKLRALDTSLYIVALSLLAASVFNLRELSGQLMLLTASIMLVGFCWFQSKRRDPLLQVQFFTQNPCYAALGISHFLYYCAILSIPFILTLFLQYIKGIDAQTTGLILISQALFTALCSPFGGWLGDRFNTVPLILSGIVLITIAMIIFSLANTNTQLSTIFFALSLIGIGIGLADPHLFNTALTTIDHKLLGSGSATLNSLRNMGGLVGMAITSLLISIYLGNAQIEASNYSALLTVVSQYFYFSVLMCVLSIVLVVWMSLKHPITSVKIH